MCSYVYRLILLWFIMFFVKSIKNVIIIPTFSYHLTKNHWREKGKLQSYSNQSKKLRYEISLSAAEENYSTKLMLRSGKTMVHIFYLKHLVFCMFLYMCKLLKQNRMKKQFTELCFTIYEYIVCYLNGLYSTCTQSLDMPLPVSHVFVLLR